MITIGDDISLNPNIELLKPQTHENITIIPIKTEKTYIDILTLKKGLELGLVEIKECETSQVNTLIVKNESITPLILIDGEEVVGGDQNRIVNSTILIDAKSEMKIPVSCSEKNRWSYKNEFKQSNYIANYRTRLAKEHASRQSNHFQDIIWSSIDELESQSEFTSPTCAMEESYENQKFDLNEIITKFKIVPGQTGVLIMIDGEIKGFEVFLNSEMYREFHEKILKSYLIDNEVKNNAFTINIDSAWQAVNSAYDSSFEKIDATGLENAYGFENNEGLGTLYLFKNTIIHWSYFKKENKNNNDEMVEDTLLKTNI
ncbi:ARPP-1 family domain-containing protein [Methanobrevibacter sp.]